MDFFIFIGGIIVLVLVLNLRGRVGRLEESLEELLKKDVIKSAITPEKLKQASQKEVILPPPTVSVPLASSVPLGPTWFDNFIEWLKEDWLLKLGALLLLIGFGWLATYAFLNNWIGPMGRIALGLIAGVLILFFGWWRVKSYLHQGSIFLVLGSTVILLTIFAAREIYNFFTPASALVVMFLSTAFVALASVKYHTRWLALGSLVLAGVAPLLTNSSSANYIGLFSYLLIVVLGAIWIVALTGQRELTTAALILVTFYSLPHLLSLTHSTQEELLLIFAYVFTAIFFITNALGIIKLKDKEITPDLVTAAGNGLFLLAWIMTAAQDEWRSLVIAAWMIVFAAGAFMIFKITQRRDPFYTYSGVSIVMLAAATAAELRGATLTIAYTLESGLISLVAYSLLRDLRLTAKVSLLLIVPIILSFESMTSRSWVMNVFSKDFFVLFILGLILLGLGLFFWLKSKEAEDKESSQFGAALLVAGSIYAYILLWLSLHAALLSDDLAVMISLVVYTLMGLLTYFYGRSQGKRALQLYGAILLGFVVARLLFIDVWKMALTDRIITFFLIGSLLVSTAFLGRKKQAALSS